MGIIAGRMVGKLISSATAQVAISYGNVLGNIVQYTILITSIIIAVDQIGIDIAFLTQLINILLASLLFGAALAFGLGAKTSVSNILASYYIHKLSACLWSLASQWWYLWSLQDFPERSSR